MNRHLPGYLLKHIFYYITASLCLHSSPSCHQQSLGYVGYFHMDPLSPETRWPAYCSPYSFSYSPENEDKLFYCFMWKAKNTFTFSSFTD